MTVLHTLPLPRPKSAATAADALIKIKDCPNRLRKTRAAGYKEAALLSKFAELAKSNCAIS